MTFDELPRGCERSRVSDAQRAPDVAQPHGVVARLRSTPPFGRSSTASHGAAVGAAARLLLPGHAVRDGRAPGPGRHRTEPAQPGDGDHLGARTRALPAAPLSRRRSCAWSWPTTCASSATCAGSTIRGRRTRCSASARATSHAWPPRCTRPMTSRCTPCQATRLLSGDARAVVCHPPPARARRPQHLGVAQSSGRQRREILHGQRRAADSAGR